MWLFILLLVLVVLCAYWALAANYGYWKKRGVPNPPVSVLFGNMGPSLTLAKSAGQLFSDIYNAYPNFMYVGYYKIRTPGIILRDPNLIKEVLIKQFNSFHDNDLEINEEGDPVGGKNPFVLKGEKWKVVRNQLTPCFTATKMKAMYPLLEDAARKLVWYLENDPDATAQNGLETREVFAKYATEIVASCGFGLEAKSFDDPDSEFRRMGKKIFQPSFGFIIRVLLLTMVPSLAKTIKVKFFSDEVVNYFRNIIITTLKYRDENKIVRNDFLDFMKELKVKSREYKFTDDDVVAHALGFFTDGFETTSAAISYTFFELAANPEIQEKLFEEIGSMLKKNGKKFDYATINEMPYLDSVVCESLRMHPPGMALLRVCTKTFELPSPKGRENGPDVTIHPGTPVTIPVYAIHYDPDYYKDPERFDPSRFSEENKHLLTKGTYLPFGEGPRACHGQRFGLMVIKTAVANVVANFEIKVNNKTILPIEIDPASFIPHAKGGIWLNFHKRLAY